MTSGGLWARSGAAFMNMGSGSSVLAIDTSTGRGEVAVWRDGAVVFVAGFESERSHNAQMFGPLREALAAAGDDLGLIAVGTGPGSYTGVRIGIAAAQGLGWSRGVPVVGICSLLAPTVEGRAAEDFVACGDARRGQFYVARVKGGALQGEIESLSQEAFQTRRAEWAGLRWFTFDNKPPAGIEEIERVRPSATRLAELAMELTDAAIAEVKARPLEPVYLSAPFVTTKRGA